MSWVVRKAGIEEFAESHNATAGSSSMTYRHPVGQPVKDDDKRLLLAYTLIGAAVIVAIERCVDPRSSWCWLSRSRRRNAGLRVPIHDGRQGCKGQKLGSGRSVGEAQ